MALSLEDRERLRPYLVPRIRQAIIKYFLYALGVGTPTFGANQITWIKDNMDETASIAEQVSIYVMSEQDFIDDGTAITDTALQSRVESVIGSDFMPAAA